jgi:hypothetical protein
VKQTHLGHPTAPTALVFDWLHNSQVRTGTCRIKRSRAPGIAIRAANERGQSDKFFPTDFRETELMLV